MGTTLAREIADIGARAIVEHWELDRYQEAVIAAAKRSGAEWEWHETAAGRAEVREVST
jgi:hypothetical protein